MIPADTRVRAVIVNHNGGDLIGRAIDSIRSSDWPGAVDIVVIDNASTDGSQDWLRERDGIRFISNPTNDGFSASNKGFADVIDRPMPEEIADLSHPDAVLLLNPDAALRNDTLMLLAARLDPHDRIGAAAPHIVFDRPFVELSMDHTGPIVKSVLAETRDGRIDVTAGCHATPPGFRVPGEANLIWRQVEPGLLRVPVPDGTEAVVAVDLDGAEGRIPVVAESLRTIVQNAGSALGENGVGQNRGYGLVDGSAELGANVPLWCGAAALLSADMLSDVGGFDPEYFLYYEDTDLALRGLARGWSTHYVADAVVAHRHSHRTTQGSRLVEILQHRNRLLTLVRHAPIGAVVGAFARAGVTILSLLTPRPNERSELWRARRRLGGWRARSLIDAVTGAPGAWGARRAIDDERTVDRKQVIEAATNN
ncbi:MAG: glycosyltransferase family 2 protein [Acidimicrobiales bacterium]